MCLRLCLVLVLAVASCARATDPDSGSGVLDCLSADSPADCLLRSQEAPGADQAAVAVPASVNSIIERIGDAIATGIGRWIPEQADDGVQDVDQVAGAADIARGHHKKKKVHKAIKKLVIKLLIALYVKQQAIKLFLYGVQTFALWKLTLLAAVWVATQVVKTWSLLAWHHHEKLQHGAKVLYIEPQIKHVTEHHAPEHSLDVVPDHSDHYDHHGYEYEPSPDVDSLWPRSDRDAAHRLAYHRQIPPQQNRPAA